MREKPFDPSDTELLRALHSHNFKNRWSQYGPICFCMSILHSTGSCLHQKTLPCNAHIPTILGCDLISYGVQITGIPL